jgi:hypothetical protein
MEDAAMLGGSVASAARMSDEAAAAEVPHHAILIPRRGAERRWPQ